MRESWPRGRPDIERLPGLRAAAGPQLREGVFFARGFRSLMV